MVVRGDLVREVGKGGCQRDPVLVLDHAHETAETEEGDFALVRESVTDEC